MDKQIISYQAKDYSGLVGMSGFSEALLSGHFKLYQGYVKNCDLVLGKIDSLNTKGDDRAPEYAELKRRLGWEFNGMRLHEYYFENLGGRGTLDTKSRLYNTLVDNFGSFDAWKKDYISTGLMRGIGWVVLYLDTKSSRLINAWINEHDAGHLCGAKPLLVMDVFEHAYLTDYQLDRAKYIEAFFNNINWSEAVKRLTQ